MLKKKYKGVPMEHLFLFNQFNIIMEFIMLGIVIVALYVAIDMIWDEHKNKRK